MEKNARSNATNRAMPHLIEEDITTSCQNTHHEYISQSLAGWRVLMQVHSTTCQPVRHRTPARSMFRLPVIRQCIQQLPGKQTQGY